MATPSGRSRSDLVWLSFRYRTRDQNERDGCNLNSMKRTVRVGGVPEHFNLPWHLAMESGAFDEIDIDVNYVEYPGGTGALTKALQSGELDVALVLTEGAVADILNGNDAKLVKVYVESPLIWGIHVASESAIETIDQAMGQRYAISRFGSGSHLMAIVDASERGWPTDKMQFVPVGNLKGARESLPKNQADVFLWEKFMTKPYVDNGEFRRVDCRSVPWPSFVVSVRNDFLHSNRNELRRVLSAVESVASQLMLRADGPRQVSERYDLQLSDTKEWFESTRWKIGFECPSSEITEVIKFLVRLDIVKVTDASVSNVWHQLT